MGTEGHRSNVDKGTIDTYSNQSIEQSVFILQKLHIFYTNYRFIKLFMGSRGGTVVGALASHRWGSSSILSSDHRWAKFVVGSFSAPRGFSPGTPVIPSPQKPALLNSNSTRNARTLNTQETGQPLLVLSSLNNLIWFWLFFYLYITEKTKIKGKVCIGTFKVYDGQSSRCFWVGHRIENVS